MLAPGARGPVAEVTTRLGNGMRIAHVIESCAGGSARAVLALIEQQSRRLGHDITLIYSPLRADAMFLSSLSMLEPVRAIPIAMKRAVGVHDVLGAWALWREIKRSGPFDVLHVHSSKAGAIGRLVGRLMRGLPVVYTPHGFVTMGARRSRWVMRAETTLSRWCDAVVAVSEIERQHAVDELGIAPDKVWVIANGLSFAPLATRDIARECMGFAPDEVVLGFVGRLSEEKNPIRAIEAFASVSGKFSNARLAVVGDGPLESRMIDAADRLQVADKMRHWKGEDARALMPGFDVLVCSSDREGMPLVFVEALQSGVPIVSTPVGGTLECVIPGVTGETARGWGANDLAEGIRSVLNLDDEGRRRMREAALQHGQRFSAERMADGVEAAYARVLEDRRRRGV